MRRKQIVRSYEFQLGYNACDNYISRTRNPYAKETPEWSDWHEGWNKRFYQELMYSEP